MATLNALTAEPTLRLMLAEAGYDPQLFPFAGAYEVFKEFMQRPSAYAEDAASFQVSVVAEPDAEPVVSVVLGRELRWQATDDTVAGVRRVLCQFDYPTLGPNVVESYDLWSTDYSSLSLFWATVEGDEAFREARERPLTLSGLFVEEG
jgi:hypothetical protein